MWPFILNTVSPWPSVRKWLLILALNLPACQCEEGSGRGMGWRELGQHRPLTMRSTHQRPPLSSPPTAPAPSVATPQLLSRRRVLPQFADKSPALLLVCDGLKIRAVSMQTHVSLFLFAGTQWLEEERRGEWQPDGSHNKTVIERYVIVTISSWGK